MKAHYDYTLCASYHCKWQDTCQRHISQYKDEHLVFQSLAHFECSEDTPEDYLTVKPEGEKWE